MFFLIRLGLLLASIAIIGGFVIEHFPSIKSRAIEMVNPVAHRDSLFAQLDSAFDELNTTTINIKNSRSPAELKTATAQQEQAIVATKALIQKIQQDSHANASMLDQGISKAVDLILGTPIPSVQPSNVLLINNTNSPITTTVQQPNNPTNINSTSQQPSPSYICPPVSK